MARGNGSTEQAAAPVRARRPRRPPQPVERVVILQANEAGKLSHRSQDPQRRVNLRRALQTFHEVTVDFRHVERARTHDLEGLLHQLQQLAQHKRCENGAIAVLCGLKSNVAEQIVTLLGARFDRATLLSSETGPETDTQTITVKFPAWERDPVRGEFLRQLIERDGPHCVWCGSELSADDRRASLDHILPKKVGGVDHLDDLVLACEGCNVKRGDLEATEWLKTVLAYSSKYGRNACTPNIGAVHAALARSAAFHADLEAVKAVVPIQVQARKTRGILPAEESQAA